MSDLTDRGPVDHIVELAHEIMEQCPARAAQASEITTWATEIRERRPSRTEIDALVDATYGGFLPHERRARLIEGLRALVRFECCFAEVVLLQTINVAGAAGGAAASGKAQLGLPSVTAGDSGYAQAVLNCDPCSRPRGQPGRVEGWRQWRRKGW
jgi:hypothetical protein